jgi:diguanylate cyclase (GGDEF)-like protein/PAS domain S-box-containing protein
MKPQQNPKIAALMTILERLAAGAKITVGALAQDLGVTQRSVYRYLDSLQAAGYPIYFDRRQRSYRLTETGQSQPADSERQLTRALELKHKMMQASSVGIAAYRFDGKCVLANEALAHMINATREQVLAQNFRSLRSWRRSGLFALAEEVIRRNEERSGDFHIVTTFGKEVWLNCVITPFESDGQPFFFLLAHDISTRKQQELATAALLAAISKGPNLTVITDNTGAIEYVSDKVREVTGHSPDEVIGRTLEILIPGEMSPGCHEDVWSAIRNGHTWTGEISCRRKDGSAFWEHLRLSPVFSADGTVSHFVASIEDITRHKQLEEELYRHATTDFLTGLYNRRMIFELGNHELAGARRHGRTLALLMVDIDHFKRINDTRGHAAGDEALRMVADACRASLRTCDLLGRVGGEEFVAVLTETSAAEAYQAAERLRRKVGEVRIPWNGEELGCTVSVGVVALAREDSSFEELLEKADRALYAAKAAGRNRVHVQQPEQTGQAHA